MRLFLTSLFVITLLAGAAFWWLRQPTVASTTTDSGLGAAATDPGTAMGRNASTPASADVPPAASSLALADQRTNDTAHTPTEKDDAAIAELNGDYPNLDMRLHEMKARNPGSQYDAEAVREALFESSAWEASDEPGAKLELSDEQLSDGREFIDFKRLKLDSLVAGDQLEIPINQTGKTYQAEITQAVANADGSVTFNGRLMDELGQVASESGSPYSVTITSGQAIVSGGIFTPEGHFVIEAVGDQGWIANASTLFKFDENEPDYVVPESIQ